jgi:hypothetical protein
VRGRDGAAITAARSEIEALIARLRA